MSGIKDTPLNRQYKKIKGQYPDCIVFFRVGDFYEVFYDDAELVSKALNIVLTSRQEGQPMAGVPHHAVDKYLKTLVKMGYKVAVCEQVEDPRTAKGIVKRDVVKVVTPGTFVEENRDNYLAALFSDNGSWGYAHVDISLGEITTGKAHDLQELAAKLSKVDVRELIIPEAHTAADKFCSETFPGVFVTKYPPWEYDLEISVKRVKDYFEVVSLVPFGIHNDPDIIAAVSILLKHVMDTQKGVMKNISVIENESQQDYMEIDAKTWRNLEIFRNSSDLTGDNTLFSLMDKNRTRMGARNLKKWLRRPLMEGERIIRRWDAVEHLIKNRRLREKLAAVLETIPDFEKSMGKISYSKGRPRDLIQIKKGLEHMDVLKELAGETGVALFEEIASMIDPLRDIFELLDKGISEEPGAGNNGFGYIKDGYDSRTDELRHLKKDSRVLLAEIQEREKERTGISSLKVKYNKVFGYFIEISKSYIDKVPQDYVRRQTLTNAERYIIDELKELEEKILNADSQLAAREWEVFSEIKEDVVSRTIEILKDARAVAQIDTLTAFAENAGQGDYCRPDLCGGGVLEVREGRHPVIETLLGAEPFIPNDLVMDSGDKLMYLVTGPNMAGKSTYLRQNALLLLMAQAGSYVPAEKMSFDPVDRIFSRVGASDNLAAGESTFMVEMLETAYIIHNATPGSFIILDEIGRGTSTYDGLSLAWSISEHIISHVGAKTLFATHYHELTELTDVYSNIHNLNITVKEWNDRVIFLRKIEEGRADKSYGIQVARLAGLPASVIERSKEILFNLETESYHNGVPAIVDGREGASPRQVDLFSDSIEEKIINEIRYIDLNVLSPLEVLDEVRKMKARIEEHDS